MPPKSMLMTLPGPPPPGGQEKGSREELLFPGTHNAWKVATVYQRALIHLAVSKITSLTCFDPGIAVFWGLLVELVLTGHIYYPPQCHCHCWLKCPYLLEIHFIPKFFSSCASSVLPISGFAVMPNWRKQLGVISGLVIKIIIYHVLCGLLLRVGRCPGRPGHGLAPPRLSLPFPGAVMVLGTEAFLCLLLYN